MKSRIFILGFLCLGILTSCEGYLDKPLETTQNEDFTFASYSNAITVAHSMYADLPQGLTQIWNSGGSAMLASATDEAEFAVQNHNVQKYNLGTWKATDMPDNPFNNYYAAIRKAYNFIANADKINFDDVKDNPAQPGIYEKYLEDIECFKSEVMLLRAYYMFELIKRYGGVPIIKEKLDADVDYNTIQRASLEDCVKEIVYWCDETAKTLPAVQPYEERQGRVTKGVALALKSQVLLFAASELWNNSSWASGYSNPEYIALPAGNRAERWEAAAEAAKAVIALEAEAGYALDTYANLFGASAYQSPEIIFGRRDGNNNTFEKVNYPISYDNVTGGNCPSQNLVDMFQVLNNGVAEDFSWSNPAHTADPYANRDPRLAQFVITNNTVFQSRPVECWTGGIDGAGVRNATPTGYYLKKYVNTGLNLNNNQTANHTWVLIRLGEIYLNYIEALNEYKPGDPDIKEYYDKIRTRAGMPGLPGGLTQDQVRQLIRQERAVELCFEGQRFWDLRRWMDKDALKAPLRSVEITKTDSGFDYEPYDLETRTFEDKMYLYPYPQAELLKMPHWKQNPGWE
ncbi:MAG: RagB/SusD family nutrient uptake outer membrane protein [Bacteroidales bacterium]|nr:RagB/SusD family nutrient uptake outer membrane protein [Bacteroidales bacterium]